MSIKIKALIIIIITLLLYATMVADINKGSLKKNLDLQEIQIANDDISKLLIVFEQEKQELASQAYDYAEWDDSYYYMNQKNPEYIEKNYSDAFLNVGHYAIIALFTRNNELYFGKYRDEKGDWHEITHLSPQQVAEIEKVNSGIVTLEGTNYVIGGHSIVLSNSKINPNGFVIFGKRLDYITSKLNKSGLDVDFKLIERNTDSAEYEKVDKLFMESKSKNTLISNGSSSALMVINKKNIDSYQELKGIDGQTIAILKVITPRKLNSIWIKSYLNIWVLITIATILIIFISYIALSKIITQPLSKLAKVVESFKPKNNLNYEEKVPYVNRKDEIGSLAKSFVHLKNKVIEGNNEILSLNESLFEEVEERTKELKSANQELMLSENIILQTSEGICVTNLKGTIIRMNNSFCALFGFKREEIIGKNIRVLKSDRHDKEFYKEMWRSIKEKGVWSGEIWNNKGNEETYPKWLTINVICDNMGYPKYYMGITSDISKLKKSEDKIRQLAYYDSLTGLPNRYYFKEMLQNSINMAIKKQNHSVLLFLDLDRFKIINDSLGHSVGDKVLIEVGKRLRHVVKRTDSVSRLGGDEFTIILEDIEYDQEIDSVLRRIIKEISMPMIIDTIKLTIGTTIGVAFAPYNDTSVEGLIMKADSAMYHAKEHKKGYFAFYSNKIHEKNILYIEMESKINEALLTNGFELLLQPKVLVEGGKRQICGAEALIRLKDKNVGFITPENFIEIAEETGLIIPIGEWVIEDAGRIAAKLIKEGIDIGIAVNVSVIQFDDIKIVEIFEKTIEKNSIKSSNLEMEITESVFKRDIKQINEVLYRIKELGIKIFLDDFGTGYSSLSSISELPIDYLKIDKSFTTKLASGGMELVSTIKGIADSLKLSVVIEGVETKNQFDILVKYGKIIIQGYYISEPLKVDDFINFYKNYMKE
ncbi:MAG: EAL domain-containing protein [Fusobacteria bacterium]|nr:EAL domain-containing protein [Fusobacteriota bacterium]